MSETAAPAWRASIEKGWAALEGGYRRADELLQRPWVTPAVLVALAGVVFAVRYSLTAGYLAAGGDYGHYLSSAHWLSGQMPTEFGHEGLFGHTAILVALIAVMPEPTATLVSGPLTLAFLVPAGFFLARRFVGAIPAIAAGATLSLAQNLSDMIGWGGNPNILAVAFSLAAWAYAIDLFRAKDPAAQRRTALLAGAFLGLVALTHSLTFVVTIVTMAPFVVCCWASRATPFRRSLVGLGYAVAATALVSLPGAASYLTLLFHAERPPGGNDIPVADVVGPPLAYLFRETAALWTIAAVFGAAAGVLLFRRRDAGGVYLVCALAIPLVLAVTFLRYNPIRPLFYLDAPLVIGFFAGAKVLWNLPKRRWIPPPLPRRAAVMALVVALLVFVPPTSMYRQQEADKFYYFLTSDDLAAMDWIRQNTPPTAVFATNGPFKYDPDGRVGNAYGWWIEGYARHAALSTGRPEDFAFDYQWGAVRDANRIFSGDRIVENGLMRLGMPGSLSQPFQPTVGIGLGADYRTVLTGEDLTLILRRGSARLSQGTNDLSATNETAGSSAFLNASAIPAVAGLADRRVYVTTQLEENRSDYTVRIVNGSSATTSFVKRVHISKIAALQEVQDLGNASHQMSLDYRPADSALVEKFAVTFGAAQPGTGVEIAWGGDFQGTYVDISVLSASSSAALRITFEWKSARPQDDRPQGIVFSAIADLLDRNGVSHLFIQQDHVLQVHRFDAPNSGFHRVFENARVVIYGRG